MDNPNILLENSIQQSRRDNFSSGTDANVLLLLGRSSEVIPQWWSRGRDMELRRFWKKSDHLSGAMYAMTAKMTTIPFKIVARDMSIKSHVEQAEIMTEMIYQSAEFGEGWNTFYSKWVEDLIGQDNGAFAEIIGAGAKDGILEGLPLSVAHLDSSLCQRTGDPEFPVVYNDAGRSYKLHYTRVMFSSLMPSSNVRMNGVGFCCCSRAVYSAQNLVDIAMYKQEKMGSRPNRQLIVTSGGLDPEDLGKAIQAANRTMDLGGLSRFSKTIAIGHRMYPNAKLDVIDLSKAPDGYDEMDSTVLGMAAIALAFGVDARELFPLMMDSASKSDAVISHIKQRGKAPGQIISITENKMDKYLLPPYLKTMFDYQDDAQDRQIADIQGTRSVTRERNLKNRATTLRIERESMLENRELTKSQFEALELEDGRLDDGSSIEVLYFSKDPEISMFLKGATQENYETKIEDVNKFIISSDSTRKTKKARQCIAALIFKFETKIDKKFMRDSKMQKPNMGGQPSLFGDNKQPPTGKFVDNSYNNGEKFDKKKPVGAMENSVVTDYLSKDIVATDNKNSIIMLEGQETGEQEPMQLQFTIPPQPRPIVLLSVPQGLINQTVESPNVVVNATNVVQPTPVQVVNKVQVQPTPVTVQNNNQIAKEVKEPRKAKFIEVDGKIVGIEES